MCFPVNFVRFLRTSFLQNTSVRLYLGILKFDYWQCRTQSLFKAYRYIYVLYVCVELKDLHINIFRVLSVYIGLKCIYQSGSRSFYKPYSEKCGLNI